MSTKHQLWIDERLAKERADRTARMHMWDLVEDQLAHLSHSDIVLEQNPLDLGSLGTSYLEQVKILFPETGPGYGEAIHKAVLMLVELLKHRQRDILTDEDRVAIGWKDDPYVFECRTCRRRVESPCNDRAGFQENGPWDGHCRQVLYPEEYIS